MLIFLLGVASCYLATGAAFGLLMQWCELRAGRGNLGVICSLICMAFWPPIAMGIVVEHFEAECPVPPHELEAWCNEE
jgi:hypothetical protein